MTRPAEFVALDREASLAAEHIAIGATALGKASYASSARYAQAFFALSVGFERCCKLAIALDKRITDNCYPSSKEMRAYGHRLRDLLHTVDEIAARRGTTSSSRLPCMPIHKAIVQCLTDFASNVTRYYNLELLGAGRDGIAATDPVAAWRRDWRGPLVCCHLGRWD